MTGPGLLQIGLLGVLLAVSIGPLGRYMAQVYSTDAGGWPERVFGPIERGAYRLGGVDPEREQRWSAYARSLLAFSFVSVVVVYGLQRVQGHLPLNPDGRGAVPGWGAFNTAVSFVTNTNWQWYSGESVMAHITQVGGLAVQHFVSAAAGMAVAVALIRGLARSGSSTIGNFWRDLVRGCVRVLLPISLVGAVLLVSQGVVQNASGARTVSTIDQTVAVDGTAVVSQDVPGGAVASMEAIKELGTNGGGYLNANSAHPFANPNGWTNLLQVYLLLLIPLSMTVTFGTMVGSKRQGRVLLVVMVLIWAVFTVGTIYAEQSGNSQLNAAGVDQGASSLQAGGNMEGKEVRFGPPSCGLYAASTTGTSTGAVNCQHDSFTPAGGMFPMVHMMLGEVSPGGVGVGLIGMLIYALLAVFIAGLMVGRTPEYLGKKIGAAEMKLVVLYIVAMPVVVLGLAAASTTVATAVAKVQTTDAHGLSELLYNFSSVGNNNGSAFAFMDTSSHWYTITMGLAMLVGRFLLIIPALAIGGSLAAKQKVPVTVGTFPTDTALFGGLVVGVVAILAGLTFFPAVALGPLLEQLSR